MNEREQVVNTFLVDVFHDVLRLQERSIAGGARRDLSLTELHVLEAVDAERDGGMHAVAEKLGVTPGTLTTSVKVLESKGYLVRQRSETDRRKILVTLSPKAEDALRRHAAFHRELVSNITSSLNDSDVDALCEMLQRLHVFFKKL